jgi:hypothetical protein
LPELLVIGVARAGFLNDLSKMMIAAGAPFEDGQIVLSIASAPSASSRSLPNK